MPSQHTDTDHSTSQQNLPPTDNDKLQPKSPKTNGKGKDGSKPQGNKKTDDTPKKKKDKNDMIIILKDLKRNTALLPKALQSPYAYEKGEKDCETCNLNKDSYKSKIKSVKIVELIVDDMISKEQNEMMDKEEEVTPNTEQVASKGEKREERKTSTMFEMSSRKEVDHNLKCVLVKLQNAIGDILLQLSYCKTKKNSSDEKCKKYDLSLNNIEHLKFEYKNLTNILIQLVKTPPKQKSPPTICVACLKEQILDCIIMMENVLQTGRNLKVSMRNDDGDMGICCSRNYPHVHAVVQGRQVVLKFELPFPVRKPTGKEETEDNTSSGVSYKQGKDYPQNKMNSASSKSKTSGSGTAASAKSNTSKSVSSCPSSSEKYCGCNFDEVYKKNNNDLNNMNNLNSAPKTPKSISFASNTSGNRSAASAKPNTSKSTTSVFPSDHHQDEDKNLNPVSKAPEKIPSSASKPSESASKVSSKPNKTNSATSLAPSGEKKDEDKKLNSAAEKSPSYTPKSAGSEPETSAKLDTSKSTTSVASSRDNKNLNSPKTEPIQATQLEADKDGNKPEAIQSETDKGDDKLEAIPSETDKGDKKPDAIQSGADKGDDKPEAKDLSAGPKKKNIDSKNTKNSKKASSSSSLSDSDDSDDDDESSESVKPTKSRKAPKNVASNAKNSGKPIFYVETKSQPVYRMGELKPQSVFNGIQENEEQLSVSSETGSKIKLPTVDSVILVKNKYSITEKSRPSNKVKEGRDSEKLFFKAPQNLNQQILRTETTMLNLENNPKRSLNKQKVSEVIKDLGATNLLSVSSPAKCCEKNGSMGNFKSVTDLPFSPSLQSLPLDQDDLNHIKGTSGKQSSVLTDETILHTDCENEWEVEFTENSKDTIKGNAEWHKAFTARDATSNFCIEIQTDKPVTKKRISKGPSNLTELRYFIIEYPDVSNKKKTPESANEYQSRKTKSKSLFDNHKYHNKIDKYFKIDQNFSNKNSFEESDEGFISDDSSSLCCSPITTVSYDSISIHNKLTETCFNGREGKSRSSPSSSDKMIMLDIINLTPETKFKQSFTKTHSEILDTFVCHQSLSNPNSSHLFAKDNDTVRINNKTDVSCEPTRPTGSDLMKQKKGITHRSEPNIRANTYSWLISFTTIINFICNKEKFFVRKNNVPSQHLMAGSSKSNNNARESELANNFPMVMSTVRNTSNDKNLPSMSHKVENKPINKEITQMSNSATLEINGDISLCLNKKHRWQDLMKNTNPKGNFNESSRTELKTKITFMHENEISLDSCKRKVVQQQSLASKCRITPPENKAKINHKNSNVKIHFTSKKLKIESVGNTRSKNEICTSVGSKFNTNIPRTTFKSLKLKIRRPEMKFPTIYFFSNQQIPIWMAINNKHGLLFLTNNKEDFGSFKSSSRFQNPKKPLEITDTLEITRDNKLLQSQVSCNIQNDCEANKNLPIVTDQLSKSCILDGPTRVCGSDMQMNIDNFGDFNPVGALNFGTLKCISSSGKLLVLYDFEGQPLPSSSGTMLVNSFCEGLLRFGCSGNPLSDYVEESRYLI